MQRASAIHGSINLLFAFTIAVGAARMQDASVPSAVALACSSSGILRFGDELGGFRGVFVAGIGSGSFDRFPFCVLPDFASEAAMRFDSNSTLEQCPFCSNLIRAIFDSATV